MPTFDLYKQQLATFFSHAKGDVKILARDILNSIKTYDDKINFVNAMEYWHYEIKNQQKSIERLKHQLELLKKVKDLPDLSKFTDDHVELIVELQKIVSAKMKAIINRQDKRYLELKILNDLCLILMALYKKNNNSQHQKKSDLVSLYLTEKDVYEACKIAISNPEILKKTSIKDVNKSIQQTIDDLLEKKKIIQLIDLQFAALELNQKGHHKLTEELNKILEVEKNNSWKHKLLYDKQLKIFKIGGSEGLEIEADFSQSANLTPERFHSEYNESSATSLLMGSTFFGHSYPAGKSKSLCLDASYAAQDISVISDGLGHFKDLQDNRRVHWAAFWTAKQTFRRAYEFKDPQQLFDHFKTLLEKVGDDIRNLGVRAEEIGTSTCVITRAFKSAQNEAVVMCGSVGDGLAFAWDGKCIHQLCIPRHYARGMQFNPLSITDKDKLTLSTIDRTLLKFKSTSLIFTMTDGVWQMLPHRRSELLQNDEVKMSYYEYRLDVDELTRLFAQFQRIHPTATVNDYRIWLQQLVQENLQRKKSNFINLAKSISELLTSSQMPISNSLQVLFETIKDNKESLQNMCLLALFDLDILIKDLSTITISEFNDKIQRFQIGDDTALSVQQVKLPI